MAAFHWPFGGKKPQAPQRTQTRSAGSTQTETPLELFKEQPVSANVPYLLPKGNQEIHRLDFQHFILRAALSGNYAAPIRSPRCILDVGSGTGRWCYEMAQIFPQASVLGCDLLGPEAVQVEKLANCTFLQADVLKGLPFVDQCFDFVHQRLLFLAIPAEIWPGEIRELVRVTHPGGWIELVEARPDERKMGKYTALITSWVVEVSRRRGIEPHHVLYLKDYLRQAGLAGTMSQSISIPVGNWGGRIGTMMATDLIAVQQALKPLIVSQLGVSSLAFEQCLEVERREWEYFRSCMIVDVISGQR